MIEQTKITNIMEIRHLFPLTLSLITLTCLTGGAFGYETTAPVDSSEAGPRLAGQIVHSITNDSRMVAGNGDISLMWFGSPANGELAFGKADFWGVVRGNITTAAICTCRATN